MIQHIRTDLPTEQNLNPIEVEVGHLTFPMAYPNNLIYEAGYNTLVDLVNAGYYHGIVLTNSYWRAEKIEVFVCKKLRNVTIVKLHTGEEAYASIISYHPNPVNGENWKLVKQILGLDIDYAQVLAPHQRLLGLLK